MRTGVSVYTYILYRYICTYGFKNTLSVDNSRNIPIEKKVLCSFNTKGTKTRKGGG